MKQKLIDVFKALGEVETKGQSTFVIADVRRILASMISEIEPKEPMEKNDD